MEHNQEKCCIVSHLRRRGLDLRNYHSAYVSEDECSATFLLWNLSGQLVGYQEYRPQGSKKEKKDLSKMKYRTQIGQGFHQPVWGLESILPTTKRIFLVEGIFDAAKLHQSGVSALAIFSSGSSRQLSQFLNLLPYQLVAILDNDDSKKSFSAFSDRTLITPSPYKDVGEMPVSEIQGFLNEHSLL